MARIGELLHGGKVTAEDVGVLQEKLLFDREPKLDRYVRFFVLLLLSAVIATYGVVSESVATVIGAMIVAPLMTPIMAVSLSVVSGDRHNIMRSLLIVAAGTAAVVGFSYVLSAILEESVEITKNSQVLSRTSPTLIDLVIALASGAAGAFATSREDVSDALPGVAIAVSLVPPLAVVGLCLSAGAFAEALGAFILFLTNFLAIVVAALALFAVMGYGGSALTLEGKRARRWGIAAITVATMIVVAALGFTSYRVVTEQILQQRSHDELEKWLEGTGFEIYSVDVNENEVSVVLLGEGEPPPFEDFLSAMRDRAGDVEVKLRIVPERILEGRTSD